MKCPMCSGKGMVDYPMYADDEHKWQYCVARMKKCDMCNGTGEVPMTNEEYIRQASTEELAKTVYEIAVTPKLMDRFFDAEVMNGKSGVEEALAWLKEKYDANWS